MSGHFFSFRIVVYDFGRRILAPPVSYRYDTQFTCKSTTPYARDSFGINSRCVFLRAARVYKNRDTFTSLCYILGRILSKIISSIRLKCVRSLFRLYALILDFSLSLSLRLSALFFLPYLYLLMYTRKNNRTRVVATKCNPLMRRWSIPRLLESSSRLNCRKL